MLWALLSSAFVIYLYRKLNAADAPETEGAGAPSSAVEEELARLKEKIEALERRLSTGRTSEAKP